MYDITYSSKKAVHIDHTIPMHGKVREIDAFYFSGAWSNMTLEYLNRVKTTQ